nr:MAG TPA: Spore cortex-lytic enzyme [Caudoviricetes sp.]
MYKPSTHYIHKSTCHWVDSTCYEITDTNDIECRKCSECNPNLEIVNPYVSNATAPVVSDYDYTLLCKIVASEYGGMSDTYERAKIVASVMNMVNDSRWPGSVEAVLDQTCAPWGFNKYSDYFCGGSIHYSAMADAVDYYFNNPDTFAGWTCNQWWGDGKYNHFRTI